MKRIKLHKDVDATFRTSKAVKSLTVGLPHHGGRNHHGRITVRHRGGGHKTSYRLVTELASYNSTKIQLWTIITIEYDPNRSGWIALISNKEWVTQPQQRYILLSDQLHVGDTVRFFVRCTDEGGLLESHKVGDRVSLGRLPIGTQVHSIELTPGGGSVAAKAAGAWGTVVAKSEDQMQIELPSGQSMWVDEECYCTVGHVCNSGHGSRVIGKAGVSRWFGIRPTVRGVAMNPVDHPHGGGGGKSKGGRPSASPWGRLTKGKPTTTRQTRKK